VPFWIEPLGDDTRKGTRPWAAGGEPLCLRRDRRRRGSGRAARVHDRRGGDDPELFRGARGAARDRRPASRRMSTRRPTKRPSPFFSRWATAC